MNKNQCIKTNSKAKKKKKKKANDGKCLTFEYFYFFLCTVIIMPLLGWKYTDLARKMSYYVNWRWKGNLWAQSVRSISTAVVSGSHFAGWLTRDCRSGWRNTCTLACNCMQDLQEDEFCHLCVYVRFTSSLSLCLALSLSLPLLNLVCSLQVNKNNIEQLASLRALIIRLFTKASEKKSNIVDCIHSIHWYTISYGTFSHIVTS